jgi:hypothetical protein
MQPQVTKEEAQWIMNSLNKLEVTGFAESQNMVAVGMKLQSIIAYEEEEKAKEDKKEPTKGK